MPRNRRPRKPTGNTFTRIYAIIRRIPNDEIATYGQIAQRARVSVRTVVWALRHCPEDVPWHRVVGRGGVILLGRRSPVLGAEQAHRLLKEGWTVRDWKVSRSKGRQGAEGGRR